MLSSSSPHYAFIILSHKKNEFRQYITTDMVVLNDDSKVLVSYTIPTHGKFARRNYNLAKKLTVAFSIQLSIRSHPCPGIFVCVARESTSPMGVVVTVA